MKLLETDFKQSRLSILELILHQKLKTVQSYNKKSLAVQVLLELPAWMSHGLTYVSIAEQGASWVLLKTQREAALTNGFEQFMPWNWHHSISHHFDFLQMIYRDCDTQKESKFQKTVCLALLQWN